MQVLVVVAKNHGRVFDRPDLVNGLTSTGDQKDPAVLVDVGYRIINPVEFLIRAASRYVSNHAPISYSVGADRLFPHAPFNEQLLISEPRLPDADNNHSSGVRIVGVENGPNVALDLNVLIGFGLPPRRTVMATCSPGVIHVAVYDS